MRCRPRQLQQLVGGQEVVLGSPKEERLNPVGALLQRAGQLRCQSQLKQLKGVKGRRLLQASADASPHHTQEPTEAGKLSPVSCRVSGHTKSFKLQAMSISLHEAKSGLASVHLRPLCDGTQGCRIYCALDLLSLTEAVTTSADLEG